MQLRWESHSHTFSFVSAGPPLHLCSSVLLPVRTVFLASLPGVAVVAKGSDVFQRPRLVPCKVKPVLQDKINCPAGQFFFSIAKCSFFIDFILISIEKIISINTIELSLFLSKSAVLPIADQTFLSCRTTILPCRTAQFSIIFSWYMSNIRRRFDFSLSLLFDIVKL